VTDSLEDRDLTAVVRIRPGSDQPIWTEPSPRRVRAFLGDVAVVDSTRALLLLEAGHLPVYYFPPTDVRADLLTPTDSETQCPYKGRARYWSARVGDTVERTLPGATRSQSPSVPRILPAERGNWNLPPLEGSGRGTGHEGAVTCPSSSSS
jgi:uncharacterized protein (DUF427 family)